MKIPYTASSLALSAVGLLFAATACGGSNGMPPSSGTMQSSAMHQDAYLSGEVLASDGLKDRCTETTTDQGVRIEGVFGAVGYASGPISGKFTLAGKIVVQGQTPKTTIKDQFDIDTPSRIISGTVKYSVDDVTGVTCTKHKLRFDFEDVPFKLKGGRQGTATLVLQHTLKQSFL